MYLYIFYSFIFIPYDVLLSKYDWKNNWWTFTFFEIILIFCLGFSNCELHFNSILIVIDFYVRFINQSD